MLARPVAITGERSPYTLRHWLWPTLKRPERGKVRAERKEQGAMGSVRLSAARHEGVTRSAETPDQALDRALKKVRESRRRRDQALLRSRLPRSARTAV